MLVVVWATGGAARGESLLAVYALGIWHRRCFSRSGPSERGRATEGLEERRPASLALPGSLLSCEDAL